MISFQYSESIDHTCSALNEDGNDKDGLSAEWIPKGECTVILSGNIGFGTKEKAYSVSLLFIGEETGFSGGPPLFPWEC